MNNDKLSIVNVLTYAFRSVVRKYITSQHYII